MKVFEAKSKVIISVDLSVDVWQIIQELNLGSALLIGDNNLQDNQEVIRLKSFLGSKITLFSIDVASQEPTTAMVDHYVGLVKDMVGARMPEIFVGIGGGSLLDLTKALSVMLVNPGKVEDYHGTGKKFTSGIKKILIPTTAGTGSEVTPGAVLTNERTKFKRAISGDFVNPDYALLNSKLTITMPDNVAAFTGIDALGHAIESYTSTMGNGITRMFAKEAFRLIFNDLPKIFEDRMDLKIRENLLLGSCLAGFSIYNSNTGAAHSMAYALGIHRHIPHGIAVAFLLPKVVCVNFDKGCNLYADLYDLIEGQEKIADRREASEKFCKLLQEFSPLERIGNSPSDFGLNAANIDFLALKGLDLRGAIESNPVEFRLDDAISVLKSLIQSI